jgi:hypothetical protein
MRASSDDGRGHVLLARRLGQDPALQLVEARQRVLEAIGRNAQGQRRRFLEGAGLRAADVPAQLGGQGAHTAQRSGHVVDLDGHFAGLDDLAVGQRGEGLRRGPASAIGGAGGAGRGCRLTGVLVACLELVAGVLWRRTCAGGAAGGRAERQEQDEDARRAAGNGGLHRVPPVKHVLARRLNGPPRSRADPPLG